MGKSYYISSIFNWISVLLIFQTPFLSAQSYHSTTVQLSDTSLYLSDLLHTIEEQSQLKFAFDPRIFPKYQKHHTAAGKVPLTSLLTDLLAPNDIEWRIVGNQIILQRNKPRLVQVQGWVQDHFSLLPICGAVVRSTLSDSNFTRTDDYGYFVLELTEGLHSLQAVSAIDTSGLLQIELYDDMSVRIQMNGSDVPKTRQAASTFRLSSLNHFSDASARRTRFFTDRFGGSDSHSLWISKSEQDLSHSPAEYTKVPEKNSHELSFGLDGLDLRLNGDINHSTAYRVLISGQNQNPGVLTIQFDPDAPHLERKQRNVSLLVNHTLTPTDEFSFHGYFEESNLGHLVNDSSFFMDDAGGDVISHLKQAVLGVGVHWLHTFDPNKYLDVYLSHRDFRHSHYEDFRDLVTSSQDFYLQDSDLRMHSNTSAIGTTFGLRTSPTNLIEFKANFHSQVLPTYHISRDFGAARQEDAGGAPNRVPGLEVRVEDAWHINQSLTLKAATGLSSLGEIKTYGIGHMAEVDLAWIVNSQVQLTMGAKRATSFYTPLQMELVSGVRTSMPYVMASAGNPLLDHSVLLSGQILLKNRWKLWPNLGFTHSRHVPNVFGLTSLGSLGELMSESMPTGTKNQFELGLLLAKHSKWWDVSLSYRYRNPLLHFESLNHGKKFLMPGVYQHHSTLSASKQIGTRPHHDQHLVCRWNVAAGKHVTTPSVRRISQEGVSILMNENQGDHRLSLANSLDVTYFRQIGHGEAIDLFAYVGARNLLMGRKNVYGYATYDHDTNRFEIRSQNEMPYFQPFVGIKLVGALRKEVPSS